jgi:hypothetical protein
MSMSMMLMHVSGGGGHLAGPERVDEFDFVFTVFRRFGNNVVDQSTNLLRTRQAEKEADMACQSEL